MKVSIIQMNISPKKEDNLERAAALVRDAAAQGADIAVLPEMFCCEYTTSAFLSNCEPAGGLIWSTLSEAAKSSGIYLVGGTMPELCGEKMYNTGFVFDPDGAQIARHRKMHLFDIDVDGGQKFKESLTFTAGDEVTVFDTKFGKVGLIICFDIRFPELSRLTALAGAEVIFCPAAFNMTTGPAHWELLFRGRACENQVFFCGCAPARDENGRYVSYANSIVTSPWGAVLNRAGADETILTADLDLNEVESIRKQLPLMSARRTDIYSLELK